jgi:uncharacterized protein (DUF58 family)
MGGRLSLRGIVEGNLSGDHRSPRQGVSLDFAQHRDYAPGDDLRHLDWRAYAKSDRYVIKQYEEETNLRAYIVLDRSQSMNYQGGGSTSKGIYGARLAAALSWTLLQQGEAVGLVTFGAELDHYLPAYSRRDHFWRLVRDLESRPWLPDTQAPEALLSLPGRLPPKGVIFLVTDGFDFRPAHDESAEGDQTRQRSSQADPSSDVAESHFIEVARALRKHGYHVILLHTLDPYELNFPFDELSLFEGLEGEEAIKVDPDGVRRAYLKEIEAFCQHLEQGARAAGVKYCLCTSDESLDQTLLKLLECIS